MFGRKPKEENFSESSELSEGMLSPETRLDLDIQPQNDLDLFPESVISRPQEPVPEVVTVIDKLSGILSPYFIVIVGLYLYKENFLIGFTLITIGVFSLLKISLKDVGRWIEGILSFVGFKD
ncbi:hypothetical protein [Gloeothece verrucosa]|uniref:Uncharacterized protein n=1 Tax=Gloeothece verrucosa (strain PCC 7822) TaxID=497965 RepID=E0U9N7_GLOV7|nr:hypothetical protein [Gloeothece verrucosa]ADN13838.1 conserved hypothetical protein [Gloeothece verrucosa PCC 7822]